MRRVPRSVAEDHEASPSRRGSRLRRRRAPPFVTETYSHGDPMASVLRAEASVLLRRRDSLGTHILDYDRLAPESSRGPEPIRTRPAMHRQQQA